MKRGFTLIELLVTMTIVSVLAGIMVPMAWKWWESQDLQTTKERMDILKRAMVGDKSLIQNGIRTSYGFVGDNGELPFANSSSSASLSFLINRPPSGYLHWNGPYLSGFEPSEYRRDAWGHPFRYTVRNDLEGYGNRYLSGEIRSAGLDGVFDTNDDLVVEINIKEVAPTYRLEGNFSSSGVNGKSGVLEITYKNPEDPSGEPTIFSGCKSPFTNFTTVIPNAAFPIRLPIGKVAITTRLYSSASCTTPKGKSQTNYFISDNISRLSVNLPAVTAE
jgi:prepilin-type N-terminal cleavage/methylation domain-containing protein